MTGEFLPEAERIAVDLLEFDEDFDLFGQNHMRLLSSTAIQDGGQYRTRTYDLFDVNEAL